MDTESTSTMEGEVETVDRSGLKRKLDESESPPQPETSVSESASTIDLNMPVVDSVLETVDTPVDKLDEMELQETDLMTQDLSEPMTEAVDLPSVSTEVPPPTENLPEALPPLDELATPAASEELPVKEEPEPVPETPAAPEPLDLPSLDASLPVEHPDPLLVKEEAPAENNITIKHETTLDIKDELPLSVGPSDEALISECEKLLEENREFEKTGMEQEEDNDDQHSSDTVSVDSDTAKAQEDDFKDEPMDLDEVPKVEPSPTKPEDPLSTLASAALGIKASQIKPEIKDVKKKNSTPWCDVGIFNTPACVVTGFYANQETNEYVNVTSNLLPSLEDLPKMNLEPGTAYKFRVCAVNSCGRGPWSEVSAFRTCLPGFPGAPSSIKISKSPEGANISWHPPSSPSGNIIEYSVCLAIKKYNHRNEEIKPNPAALTFEKVYSGPSNHAIVSHAALSSAYVDVTNKPAIIFRIAAKNEKGYGPATQVRWLQDVYVPKK